MSLLVIVSFPIFRFVCLFFAGFECYSLIVSFWACFAVSLQILWALFAFLAEVFLQLSYLFCSLL